MNQLVIKAFAKGIGFDTKSREVDLPTFGLYFDLMIPAKLVRSCCI